MKRLLFVLVSALLAFFVTSTAAQAAIVVTIDLDNAPSGTHFANRSPQPNCTVDDDLSVDCNAYVLGGVGNTNAFVSLTASYSAIVDCFNPGANRNNPIESHETTFDDSDAETLTPSRNGQLRVTSSSVSPETGLSDASCPNPNWDPEIRDGTLKLVSFTYTLTFAGFTSPYITVTGP
jgi:hypothetical protein